LWALSGSSYNTSLGTNTVISSHRPLDDWGQILGDTAAAGAMLDRFLHHAEIIQLKGRSFRMHDRQRRRSAPTDLTSETD
jgi:DNA replication protein DnaC